MLQHFWVCSSNSSHSCGRKYKALQWWRNVTHSISLRITSGSPRVAATAFTLVIFQFAFLFSALNIVYANLYLATFLLKVANLNFVSDLSSYFSCRGLKVLIDARILQQGMANHVNLSKLLSTHGFQKTFISRRIWGSSPLALFRKLLSFNRIHFLSPFFIQSSGIMI